MNTEKENPGISGKSRDESWINPSAREQQKKFIIGSKEIGESTNLFGRSDLGEEARLYDSHVWEALARSPEIDTSGVEVAIDGATVELSGTVSSEKESRAVQKIIENLSGVEKVTNHLRVS